MVWRMTRSKVKVKVKVTGLLLLKFQKCTFLGLSPLPFTMAAGKWPLILKLQNNIYGKFDRAGFLLFVLVFCHMTLNLEVFLWIVRPQTFSDFNEIWCVDRGRWVMHDRMPYDPIQGQGQGHECLKATQEDSTVSPTRTNFVLFCSFFPEKRTI